jgi:alkaline phosphatase D
VLWTRLAPKPLEGGGMPRLPLPVVCEFGHSIHADVRGLKPGREYFYRFLLGRHESPIGRTKTAPAGSAKKLRFAFVSCQDYQNGYYTAYADMAQQDLDVVVHLGDYIYEYAADPAATRQHDGAEVESLESYRNRYPLYRTDANLQAAHAAFPFVVTPDDHEVENNYATLTREEGANPNTIPFAQRRANAYRAYWRASRCWTRASTAPTSAAGTA